MKLWNTATRSLVELKPIDPPNIGLYTCGPTVYWTAHIGNLRTYVFEDILQRSLELEGYTVKRVMNVTDVGHLTSDEDEGEDKIEAAATKEGKTAKDISDFYLNEFLSDAQALNIKIPSTPFLCKATEHIDEQIGLIKTLESKGFTYQTSDGVYFDTSKFPAYGKLSGQKLEEKEEGARVEANSEKRNKTDFALWKFSPADSKRQQEWKSPWGVGFPGWHIECSAMSRKFLGQPFDIHCGGVDHIPVHHENEIAQSEAAYGVPLANIWMHGEFLLVDNGKMSKSLGNVYTVADLEKRNIDPLALRLLFLGTHYRQKQNFTWEALESAKHSLSRLRRLARTLEKSPPNEGKAGEGGYKFVQDFTSSLKDGLNTPIALAVMWKLLDSGETLQTKASVLAFMDRVLGLSLDDVIAKPLVAGAAVKELCALREEARQKKDWKEADRLREEMETLGWTVEDTKEGPYLTPVIQ